LDEKKLFLERLYIKPSSKMAKILLILGFILSIAIIPVMQYFTQLSGFPANFIISQLSFNGEIMKSYYSITNIELYRISPSLDYIFMLGYGLVLFSSSLLIARTYEKSSLASRIVRIIAIFGIIAAIFDGIENIFILAMLMDPLAFPNALAVLHSVFALIKWIIIFISVPGLIITGGISLYNKRKK